MKCPLMQNKQVNYAGEYGRTERASFGDCIEGNCAWWDRETQSCAVKAIASILYFRWIRDYNLKEKS